MSKIADLALEIEEMYYEQGMPISEIAKVVPLSIEDIAQFIADMEYDREQDQFNSDLEADADALASAGFGTDEDYGYAEDVL
jgi:hypothetical protein